jgi:uroporphyrinogen-III decarboxylase
MMEREMEKTTEELYRERAKRVADALQLKVPDRVPLEIAFGYFPSKYTGVPCEAAYYDYDQWLAACKKTVLDFGADVSSVQPFFPGKVLELIDPKNMMWPGQGAFGTHQFIEGEFMKPDEYDALLGDPTDYMLRFYWPRVSGAMKPFKMINPFSLPAGGYRGIFTLADALSTPEIASTIERLQKVGKELSKWRSKMVAFDEEIQKLGFPPFVGSLTLAPFDVISDNLRGMKGTMLDMYRQPDKLLEGVDGVLKRMLELIPPAVPGAVNTMAIPLHRGSEGFMSIKQFEKFYWPTLKGLILGLIDKGLMPLVFYEGDYTSRLEYLLELPKGKVFAHFDTTDMFRAKEVLNGHMCICGNVPCSLLQSGTPDEVKAHAKKLIDVCGKDGGFIMSTRSPVDDAKPDTLKALIDFTIEYSVYR